jgi:ribonuclease HI
VIDIITTAETLKRRYTKGPTTGIFTDGSAKPNPGDGGWGFVHVLNNQIISFGSGKDLETTNNRMELTALIKAFDYISRELPISEHSDIKVYTDSQLCVNTINQWAHSWKKNNWRRKTGEIKNLDLVKTLYDQKQNLKQVELAWVPGHSGWLWNEVVDLLADANISE